ncbi:unnamed protein product [Cuscuta epithymum]|uniref:HAT C-terminal dimerisation domain-containing protein n=1 Tax=Cuscuta epithymum TaxID=186058 RepID=A0AAV0F6H0_9ASTE|nr:unnamed protein product [Cuscuta epithymum]
MKFELLEHCFNKRDPNTSQEKLSLVKEKLYLLFDQYKSKSVLATSSNVTPTAHASVTMQHGRGLSIFNEIPAFESQNITDNGKSSLDMYLEEGRSEMKYFYDMDVLQYWSDRKMRYGDLALMACDVLSIPITTVASEPAFSIGSRVLTKYRSCILPARVQALLCSRNWLKGYKVPEDDDESTGDGSDPPLA